MMYLGFFVMFLLWDGENWERNVGFLFCLINAEKLFEFLEGTEYCNNYKIIFST